MYFWIITVMLSGSANDAFDISISETAFGPMSREECVSYDRERTHALANHIYESVYNGISNGYHITDVDGKCVESGTQ